MGWSCHGLVSLLAEDGGVLGARPEAPSPMRSEGLRGLSGSKHLCSGCESARRALTHGHGRGLLPPGSDALLGCDGLPGTGTGRCPLCYPGSRPCRGRGEGVEGALPRPVRGFQRPGSAGPRVGTSLHRSPLSPEHPQPLLRTSLSWPLPSPGAHGPSTGQRRRASSQRLGPPLVCRGRAFWLPVPLPSPHPARKGFSSGDGAGQSHPTPRALWGAQMGEGGHTCPDAPSWVGRGVGWDWTGAPGWCWGWGAWRGRSKEGQPALPLAPASVPGPGHPPRPRPLAAPLPPPDPAWPCPHPP